MKQELNLGLFIEFSINGSKPKIGEWLNENKNTHDIHTGNQLITVEKDNVKIIRKIPKSEKVYRNEEQELTLLP